MVYARIDLNGYSNRVLNVIKAKYGLRDKSSAINKMADLYGDEFVEREASKDYVRELDRIYDEHVKKYGYRSMSFEELDRLCEA